MSTLYTSKSPFYYVKKRLYRNKTAMFGLIVIALAHLIALMGYSIMPDKTPNATDGAIQVAKRPPIFTVRLLRVRKNMEIQRQNFFMRMYYGQESEYTITPLASEPYISGDSVYFVPFESHRTRGDTLQSRHLLDVVIPIFVGDVDNQSVDMVRNLKREGDVYTYISLKEELRDIKRDDVIAQFWENCVVERIHFFGTDKSGRDMLSRMLSGTRVSLTIGAIAVLISLVVGIFFGGFAGFFGGKIDNFVMWLMTVIWSIPTIMLVIAISLALQSRGAWVAFVAVGLTMWVDIARVVRGQIMSIKQKLFVEAARAFGFSNNRIIFKHIMPNILGPLIVISTSNFASAILIEAGLSFLGLGVHPPQPSWGMMIKEGYDALGSENSWHLILIPGIAISLMVLSFNLFGNGLRDAYDPQSLK